MTPIPLEPWFHPRLQIRASRIQGRGVFSAESILQGETVMVFAGQLFSRDDVASGKAKLNSITCFSEDLYLGQKVGSPDLPDHFLNHSCDPNLWMADEVTLVARRDIMPGDEVTADYALWELHSDWVMETPCNCGTRLCRGMITGADWRLSEIQRRYQGHFLPCINTRIIGQSGIIELVSDDPYQSLSVRLR